MLKIQLQTIYWDYNTYINNSRYVYFGGKMAELKNSLTKRYDYAYNESVEDITPQFFTLNVADKL